MEGIEVSGGGGSGELESGLGWVSGSSCFEFRVFLDALIFVF